ncbi:hypothetical protein [Thiohalocapsa halophila]|uniref:hypothetical protein n=1 Tax=Thiohalocapsa halophila TaxID=69359 RepID=UPI0019062AFE|nr:hypothetical protein [Thiohalocapsa halophila]
MSTTAASPASRWLPSFKWTVYGLLAVNIVLFLLNETVTDPSTVKSPPASVKVLGLDSCLCRAAAAAPRHAPMETTDGR